MSCTVLAPLGVEIHWGRDVFLKKTISLLEEDRARLTQLVEAHKVTDMLNG